MSSLEQSYLQPEFLELSYKLTPKEHTLIFRLFGPSQYFLKCHPLHSNPNLDNILSSYTLQQQTFARVKFHLPQGSPQAEHAALKKEIGQWMERFQIAVINYSAINKDKVKKAVSYLEEHHQEVKSEWTPSPQHATHSDCIIYFPHQLKSNIERILCHFQRHEHHNLVFPLNWFIKKQMDLQLWFTFMQALAKEYNNDLKKIPLREKIPHLVIHNVEAYHVDKKFKTKEWSKEERNGIDGLQFRVEGFDYEVRQLYSSLEQFFQKIHYCVHTLETVFNCPQQTISEAYIKQRYNNRMLRYIPLSKNQLVIIGPPEHYSKAIAEISKTFWTIDPNYFLNLDFTIIKRKEHAFRRYLKQRSIQFQDMLVSNNTVTFFADKNNYERIKHHSKDFLLDFLEQEIRIPFVESEKKLDIFNEFTISKSQLTDVELFWERGCAFCRCPAKITKNMFNHIRDIYEEHQNSMVSTVSLKYVKKKYVITQENPDDLVPQKYIQWRFRPQRKEELEIVIKDYQAGVKDDNMIFMVSNPDECVEMGRLVGEETASRLGLSKQKFTLLLVQNSPLFSSIIYWKLRFNSTINFTYQNERIFLQLKQITHNQNKPLQFVITRQFFRNSMQIFKSLLVNLIESQQSEWRNVTVTVSDELTELERDQLMNFFVKTYQEEYPQKFRIDYRITTNLMKEICLMRYINFEWDLLVKKKEQKEGEQKITIKGSSLNSFVFFWQKQKTSYSGHHIVLVLPKLESKVEILVQMNSCQAFEVFNNELIPLQNKPLQEQIQLMIKILTPHFKHQNYIVLYSDILKTKLISTVYIYSPKHQSTLKKYKIEKNDSTVKNLREEVVFRMEVLQIDRYRHTTHHNFQGELMKFLN